MMNHWSGGGMGRFVAPGNMLSAGQNMSKHLPPVRMNGVGRYIGVRGLGLTPGQWAGTQPVPTTDPILDFLLNQQPWIPYVLGAVTAYYLFIKPKGRK